MYSPLMARGAEAGRVPLEQWRSLATSLFSVTGSIGPFAQLAPGFCAPDQCFEQLFSEINTEKYTAKSWHLAREICRSTSE